MIMPNWPEGTEVLRFENLDGLVLVSATLRGTSGSDTTGPLVFDTGAGYLALDNMLALRLGIADSSLLEPVGVAARPLPRLSIATLRVEGVDPLLLVDGAFLRRVTDRPLLGLLGQQLVGERAVWIDYRDERLALIPVESGRAKSAAGAIETSRGSLGSAVSPQSIAVPFHLAGDGKVLVNARVIEPDGRGTRWLTLIVDTGATQSVIFEDALQQVAEEVARWPSLRGMLAPTLFGATPARVVRVPALEVEAQRGAVRAEDVETVLLHSGLERALSQDVGEPVSGLLGYSFLRRFRIILDYPNRVLWLDAGAGSVAARPFEFSHVGLQLERDGRMARVVSVAEGSPAALAGVEPGDELESVDGESAAALDMVALARRLEGPPGSEATLVLRRGTLERTYRLVRRRLL